jgi:hypothetical protein
MLRFNNLSVRVKMSFAQVFLVAAMIGFSCYSAMLLGRSERSLELLSEGAFRRATLVASLNSTLSNMPDCTN